MSVNYAILHVQSAQGQVWVAAALAGMVKHFLAEQQDFAGTDNDQGKQPKRGIPGQLFERLNSSFNRANFSFSSMLGFSDYPELSKN